MDYLAMPVISADRDRKREISPVQRQLIPLKPDCMMEKHFSPRTSHNFGDNFYLTFENSVYDKDIQAEICISDLWGMTTRLIGAIIMVHGDNRGLVLAEVWLR